MIVDTSVLVAILLNEPDAPVFARILDTVEVPRLSAAGYVELCIVIDARRDPALSLRVDELIGASGLVIEPVTADQARIAREAYRLFGRGNGHPARLNYGDCFAYALAKSLGEPLLFKGDDFIHTDVAAAAKQG